MMDYEEIRQRVLRQQILEEEERREILGWAELDPDVPPPSPSHNTITFRTGDYDQDRFVAYRFAIGGGYYPVILERISVPMQIIEGSSGFGTAKLVARAQWNRLRGRLAGKKGAPYLTGRITPDALSMRMASMSVQVADTVNPWDSVTIKNVDGATMDYAWLFEQFGPITLERADPVECMDGKMRVMRLVEAQESIGPAVLVVDVEKEDGSKWDGVCVARGWPGAPGLPGTPLETIRWREQAVYGFTENGAIGFGLGTGDYYWRYDTQAGVSYIFTLGILDKGVVTPEGGLPSDFVDGTGMLAATEHRGLLRFKYRWMQVGDDPVDPEPEDDDDVIALLTEIRDLLAAGGGSFPAQLDFEGYTTGKIRLPDPPITLKEIGY